MTINFYSQYFAAAGNANGRDRRGALVNLISDSEAGMITYSAQVTFFPHDDDNDFAISYDAEKTEVLFSGTGRRSKKKEAAYLEEKQAIFDKISEAMNMKIFWDKPLREAKFG